MTDPAGTLIVMPLFNEEKTILPVLEEIRRLYGGEILVVNDGSTDSSLETVEGALNRGDLRKITILNHEANRGYGGSLISGFQYAIREGFETVLTMDGDGQHPPSHIPEFLALTGEYDIVSGSRYLRELPGNTEAPSRRYDINRKITELIRRITPYAITDAFCGYKALRVEALRKLSLDEEGYAFPLQFWIQGARHGLTLREIPVGRLYLDLNRSFGETLDNPEIRLRHYLEVLEKEQVRTGRGKPGDLLTPTN